MRVLLIDDEENLLLVLKDQLIAAGMEVATATDGESGLKLVGIFFPDVVVSDLRMEGLGGLEVIARMQREYFNIPILVLTAYGEIDTAVEAIKAGAVDYITKPVELEVLVHRLRWAVEVRRRTSAQVYLQDEAASRLGFTEFVGASAESLAIRNFIESAAASSSPVLITGETGSGKELIARLIHRQSDRSGQLFMHVNCRNPHSNLLFEELFGRVAQPGSFHRGKFEIGNHGTLLLDEVGELPLDIQAQLVDVLERALLEPGSGQTAVHVDVRIIAASRCDLNESVSEKTFRADLYHRLNVLSLRVPDLSVRRADIEPLAKLFLGRFSKEQNRETQITDQALKALLQYEWPGNVRELSNILERALAMSIDGKVKLSDLPPEIIEMAHIGQSAAAFGGLREKVLAEERRLILQALEKNDFIQNRAAKALRISRSLLSQKIKRLGIELPGLE